MMYCTTCGKQIADDAVLCPYCGMSARQGDTLAELVAAARSGDQDAISALYEKSYSNVYYTAKSMIKVEDSVFDIVQDTYIKAFAHLDSFQGDTKFLPWVRQIAANTARDWLKRKRPMLFTELGSGEGQDTPVEELFADERSENLPDQVIDQQETTRLIREILEELPEDQRAAIGMFYYEEMSVKEIAAAMDVSESAVKSRLMYGRGKIEKKVLELEKQGTKLYSLSPLPFLLLLFRNQAAYAAEVPDSRILHAILASRPMGAATAAGAAKGAAASGGAAGAEAVSAAAAGTGTGAVAGGLGALKIGLIALAAVTVVGLGVFGAIQIASNSAESQEAAVIEDVTDQEEPEASDAPEGDSQSAEGTEGSEGEDSQSDEEAEEEVSFSYSYIFSDMPIAAYEVTGLGVGRFESVNEEMIYFKGDTIYFEGEDEGGYCFGNYPFIRRTPGENTFVLFCMQGDEEGMLNMLSATTIHSPSGSSQWEAITYTSEPYSYTFGSFSSITRARNPFNEEKYDRSLCSYFDPVSTIFGFAEIYHPDSPQDDTIYVIEVNEHAYAVSEGYDEIDKILARMVNVFEELGATDVKEIPVEEALAKYNVVISEGAAN